MSSIQWFALFAGANGLIVVILATLVSYRRIKLKVPHGDGGQVAMKQAIRTHGNTVEHVPMMGLILLGLCLADADAALVATLVCAFTLARLLYPFGMLGRLFNARRLASLVTYLAEAVGAVLLLLTVLSSPA